MVRQWWKMGLVEDIMFVRSWPVIIVAEHSWALSSKATLVAEIHGVHAYSATHLMPAM